MSTTDNRAAFEAWAISENGGGFSLEELTRTECDTFYVDDDLQLAFDGWRAALDWQAATEAAKATGTPGDLPPLPPPTIREGEYGGPAGEGVSENLWNEEDVREFGYACAEAARHDKDGNHADDLRGMLEELQTEFDKQQSAFWACSEKLAQIQRNQETELSDIRILELAEEDFGEQDDRNVKNEALLSFARKVQAARQPAPALSVKTWQERLKESASEGWTTLSETHMQAEIAELRSALASPADALVAGDRVDARKAVFAAYSHCLANGDSMLPQEIADHLIAAIQAQKDGHG